ncbi:MULTISPECIES: acetolactate synthase AlsS [Acetobacteraceae]|uniref:Acetolactate synthase AlsS n=1 Tax=Parasaccharibacter apium TaxID=1510841 RepID=A0A7U7G5Q4_9PROT|nr:MULTISPECIES: acetolactate synthase AlsS [Acetobacteraceae]MCQ0041057.1 acetolactate synthase AlsS [Bombella sp.]MUG79630.1 acetolactate synthase AlsS [Bombella sp. ESL0380]QGT75264.1 acetolactate synthase AlsS [Bombella sp. ESL0368]MCL1511525.1 acetolactate synthase AlsS [Parasaccharibacter sp. TMW 2.1884]MCL1513578.1 acetolactate synthase AlsS [Parasaccharibacter sp. TMW 2.1891]
MTQKKSHKAAQTAADLIVRNLEAHGVDHIVGIPGAKIDRLFEALEDSPIRTIVARHEQNAVFMAGGIGRITGRAGVAIATSGPGVSNLATGLATATSEGDPVLTIGGAVGRADLLKLTHQSMDTVSMLRPVTKYSAEIGAPAATSEVIGNAFRAAESPRQGGVFVSVPMDVLNSEITEDYPVMGNRNAVKAGPAPEDVIKEAAAALKKAKKPVVLLGMKASKPENAEAIRAFVKQTNLPVVGTYQAAGAVSKDLVSRFGGRVGLFHNQYGDYLLDEADLVVAIGYNPIEYDPCLWNRKSARPIINIDVVPAQLDNAFNPEIELIGSIALSVQHLTRETGALTSGAALDKILEVYRASQKSAFAKAKSTQQGMLHPLEIIKVMEDFVAQDITICLDMGSFHIWHARFLEVFRARQMLISNGQQTMGVALPWAMSASIVNPAQKVISVSGDGSFMMSSMDLETAVRLKSNLIHIIWVDQHFNMVRIQEEKKYGRDAAVAFGPIDFAAFARSFGAKGINVNSVDSLKAALREGMETQGPVVIAVPVDYADNPALMNPLPELSK